MRTSRETCRSRARALRSSPLPLTCSPSRNRTGRRGRRGRVARSQWRQDRSATCRGLRGARSGSRRASGGGSRCVFGPRTPPRAASSWAGRRAVLGRVGRVAMVEPEWRRAWWGQRRNRDEGAVRRVRRMRREVVRGSGGACQAEAESGDNLQRARGADREASWMGKSSSSSTPTSPVF